MSKAMYRVTIASGKGQTLAVVFTSHPEIVRLIRRQWSQPLLGWRKSGAYRLRTQKLDPERRATTKNNENQSVCD
jgi:hypothetical protein